MVRENRVRVKRSKKIRNPLSSRYLRELRGDLGKYLVIFLLMVMSIAEVSGFLVADESMINAYNESFEKYRIEDGHFETDKELSSGRISKIEENGITVYPQYYIDAHMSGGTTLRIFSMRDDVNLADLMDGEFPEKTGEIAIDRMYAKNNGIKIGDTVSRGNGRKKWLVTGYVALSDYSALFESNNDSMFDAVQFGVAVVTQEEFSSFSEKNLHYNYAWLYDSEPGDTAQEEDTAGKLEKKVNSVVPLEQYIPRYMNQAIQFTGNDMGGDRAMMMVLLYMIIAILGFVFAVTISNTIRKEAGVIGTLRASGYTRGELVRHYMVMPIIVTLVSAAVGNILGYTFMKDLNAGLYYGSYSLPTYRTVWSGDAMIETTVIPIIMMVVITFLILHRALKTSPLDFLRGQVRRRHRSRTVHLPHKLPIFTRYRIRVLFQNLPNYLIMFFGIIFADVLLMFGLAMPLTLVHYQETLSGSLLSKYQYFLSAPSSMERDEDTQIIDSLIEGAGFYLGTITADTHAEKFSFNTLKTMGDGGRKIEDVTFYGLQEHSDYVDLNLKSGDVYISEAYAEKYDLHEGSNFTLKEQYGDKTYTFTVTGIYDYLGSLCVFMPIDDLNDKFGYMNGFFAGYFSNDKITDIDSRYLGTVVDLESLTKISRQLDVSMGDLMNIVDAFAVIMFMIIVYLLTKTIIERNAHSISISKILGYRSAEISRLYLMPTTLAAAVMLAAAIPVVKAILTWIYNIYMLTQMPGYMPVYMDTAMYLKMFGLGFGVYLVVMLMEMRKIRKIPMDMALKVVE